MEWKYQIFREEVRNNLEEIENRINKLGKQGWEAISVSIDETFRNPKLFIVFKKAKNKK